MVNREIFWKKLSTLETHLARVRLKRDVSMEDLRGDLDRQESILFNLQMAIQNCIDMAAHVVSDEEMGIAGSTHELFYLLQDRQVIDSFLAEKLVKAVGFRNILVHEYGRVDLNIVYRVGNG
jgi:uncharacterized protein YutE (UPF0331/DUF86 family)